MSCETSQKKKKKRERERKRKRESYKLIQVCYKRAMLGHGHGLVRRNKILFGHVETRPPSKVSSPIYS